MKIKIDIPNLKYDYAIYSNGDIINENTGKKIKPVIDKRRLHKPPYIYFKLNDGKRYMIFYDELMAMCFISNYQHGMYIYHINGNMIDCTIENLQPLTIEEYISTVINDDHRWKKINILNVDLYFEYFISDDGRVFNGTTFKLIKPFCDPRNKNLMRYNLYTSVDQTIKISAGRLVAMHFINKIEGKDIVYFKDGNCTHCTVDNIAWGDRNDVVYNTFMLKSVDKSDGKIDLFKEEKWKPINDDRLMYEYEISNYGRVYNSSKKAFLKQSGGFKNSYNQSYMSVSLRMKTGEYIKVFVHRLVGIYFVKGYSKDRRFINHINGNPEFNYYKNLEWVTSLDNLIHAINTNLLHTKEFKSTSLDPEWRTKNVVSWIVAASNDDLHMAYEIYYRYRNIYEGNIIDFDESTFVSFFNNKIKNDTDFMKIYNFYSSVYK